MACFAPRFKALATIEAVRRKRTGQARDYCLTGQVLTGIEPTFAIAHPPIFDEILSAMSVVELRLPTTTWVRTPMTGSRCSCHPQL